MKQKSFYKVGTAVVLVLAITTTLWFAAPVSALNLSVPTASGTIGGSATITATINVVSSDVLPILSVDLEIFNDTYSEKFVGLPLATVSGVSYTGINGSSASISAVAGSGWGYGYATSRGGYGYAYGIGWGYHYVSGNTFGYGYYPPGGATSIAYTAVWNVPSNWSSENYTVRLWVNANGTSFIEDGTISLSAATTEHPSPVRSLISPPGVTDVSDSVDSDGVFTEDVTAESEDGKLEITIDEGITGLTENERPLRKITITEMEEPPPLPEDFPANVVALTYDIEPDGATFDQLVTITFTYDESLIPDGVAEEDLVLAYYDESRGEWVILTSTVNTGSNTIIAGIRHFTAFTVLALTSPAAFTASDLSIVPDEVDIGEEVAIGILITNTGDLAGSYEVTLNIDGVAVATEEVTVAGGASETATFTATKNAAGTYEVTVDGLSGTFVVKKAPVAPPAPAPAPAPAPSPPAPPVVPPVLPPTPINWWLIGGIIAGVIVISVLTWQFLIRRRA